MYDTFIKENNPSKRARKKGNYQTSQKGGGGTPALVKDQTISFFSYEGFPKNQLFLIMIIVVNDKYTRDQPFRTIQDHTRPYTTTHNHTGSYRSIMEHTGAYRTLYDLMWTIRTIPNHTGPYWPNRDHKGLYGTIQQT